MVVPTKYNFVIKMPEKWEIEKLKSLLKENADFINRQKNRNFAWKTKMLSVAKYLCSNPGLLVLFLRSYPEGEIKNNVRNFLTGSIFFEENGLGIEKYYFTLEAVFYSYIKKDQPIPDAAIAILKNSRYGYDMMKKIRTANEGNSLRAELDAKLGTWKDRTSAHTIRMYLTPNDDVYEVIEHYAEKKPEMIPYLISSFGGKGTDGLVSVSELVKHYENVDLETVPKAIADIVTKTKNENDEKNAVAEELAKEKAIAAQRKSEEKARRAEYAEKERVARLQFKTVDGRDIYLGELNNKSLYGFDAAKEVCDKFIESGLTKSEFCEGIGLSEWGMNKIISIFKERVKAWGDEYGKKVVGAAKNKYPAIIGNMRDRILEGDTSFIASFQWNDCFSYENILAFRKDTQERDLIIKNVIDYYVKRLSEYDGDIQNSENIDKFLNMNELCFLIGEENMRNFCSGQEINYRNILPNVRQEKEKDFEFYRKRSLFFRKISAYEQRANSRLGENESIKVMIDGQYEEVTEDVYSEAVDILKEKKLAIISASVICAIVSIMKQKNKK